MIQTFPARRALIVAALFAVAGCSGGPSTPGSSALPSSAQQQSKSATVRVSPRSAFVHAGAPFAPVVSPHAALQSRLAPSYVTTKPLVFEADQEDVVVNVFAASALPNNPAPIVAIPVPVGCPYGMAMDKTGALYVATNCGGNTVEVYAKGKTSPARVISNGISNPLGLAINSKGTLFVSNYPGAITEYPSGQSSPSKTIAGQGLSDPFGLALDSKGNLYVADFGASQVFEIAAGSSTVKALNLQDLSEPLGVAIDKKTDDLWVTDGAGDKVNVYKHGATTPSESFSSGYTFPYAISIYETGSVVISNIEASPNELFAYKPNKYTPYATVTNGTTLPTGVLWAQP